MASNWKQSKLLWAGAAAVALLLVALLVAPYFLDIDRYRPAIVEALAKETGRAVEIERLGLHFLPSVHVHVANLRLKNPRGFPAGDTVAVERIDIGLAFWPLLRRQVEVTSVTIQSVAVNLLTNQRGRTNSSSLLARRRPSRAQKQSAEAVPAISLTRVGSVALEDVSITAGTFRQGRKRVYPAWTISGINLEARGFDFSEAQWLKKVEAEIDLSTIEMTSPALRQPLRFSDGDVAVKENAAEGDFTLALGQVAARGTLKVADLAKPVADFTLTVKELNTEQLAAVLAGGKKGGPKPPSGGRSGRSRLLARGTMKVDRVLVPPLRAGNLQAKVRLYSNRLEMDPFSFNFYSGRTRGSLGVNLSQAALPARVNAKVEGVNVLQVVEALSPKAEKKVTGTLEADARLGLPLGADDPLAGLSGQGNFAVRDGTFPGLDLQGTLAGMAKFFQMDLPQGDTRFTLFGGDFRISRQRVHSNKVLVEAESLEATLRGSFGFDQTLNYTGSGLLTGKGAGQQRKPSRNPITGIRRLFGKVAQQTIGRGRVPFTVRGTFQDPKFILAGPPQPVQ